MWEWVWGVGMDSYPVLFFVLLTLHLFTFNLNIHTFQIELLDFAYATLTTFLHLKYCNSVIYYHLQYLMSPFSPFFISFLEVLVGALALKHL